MRVVWRVSRGAANPIIRIKIDDADMLVVVQRHAGTCNNIKKRVRSLSGELLRTGVVGCLVPAAVESGAAVLAGLW